MVEQNSKISYITALENCLNVKFQCPKSSVESQLHTSLTFCLHLLSRYNSRVESCCKDCMALKAGIVTTWLFSEKKKCVNLCSRGSRKVLWLICILNQFLKDMVEFVLVNGEEGVCCQGKNDQSIALGSHGWYGRWRACQCCWGGESMLR